MLLRRNDWYDSRLRARLNNFTSSHETPAGPSVSIIALKYFYIILTSEWTLGDINHYAGWHCSWCYSPPGIKIKMESAQRHDKPRWGDFPDKLDLDYIASLIRNGEWFDGKHPLIPVNRRNTSASIYAPPFFLDNEDRFEHLLVHPDDMVWQNHFKA